MDSRFRELLEERSRDYPDKIKFVRAPRLLGVPQDYRTFVYTVDMDSFTDEECLNELINMVFTYLFSTAKRFFALAPAGLLVEETGRLTITYCVDIVFASHISEPSN